MKIIDHLDTTLPDLLNGVDGADPQISVTWWEEQGSEDILLLYKNEDPHFGSVSYVASIITFLEGYPSITIIANGMSKEAVLDFANEYKPE